MPKKEKKFVKMKKKEINENMPIAKEQLVAIQEAINSKLIINAIRKFSLEKATPFHNDNFIRSMMTFMVKNETNSMMEQFLEKYPDQVIFKKMFADEDQEAGNEFIARSLAICSCLLTTVKLLIGDKQSKKQ